MDIQYKIAIYIWPKFHLYKPIVSPYHLLYIQEGWEGKNIQLTLLIWFASLFVAQCGFCLLIAQAPVHCFSITFNRENICSKGKCGHVTIRDQFSFHRLIQP